MNIYHYDGTTGLQLSPGVADADPLDPDNALLPAYAALTTPPATGEFECTRYLTPSGDVPAHHAEGAWVIQSDWRGVELWSTTDGSRVEIIEPNVTPADKSATATPYPGPGHVWRDGQWQADPALQYQLAEQAAEQELAIRQAEASAEINRIQPAVDGGYAKPADAALLPLWQRYRYELPDVRSRPGWPEQPDWPPHPGDPATK
ncbi:tail fiber assembly protein [Aeromonas caviae]